MDELVLENIKRMLGVTEYSDEFDYDIISLINSALFTLSQLGIGNGSSIDKDTTWSDITSPDRYEIIREYLYLRTKEIFDTPQSSYASTALKERMSEMEFRLNIDVD